MFAVNFGQIGFLATIDPSELREGFRRRCSGEFEVLTLPALALHVRDGAYAAINDLSIHRKLGARVAQLAYELEGEQVGSVRCDGVVVATPAGSTGYNLANGGPVLAWGVEGFVVSFIAPHSLTARALVVAPDDTLTVHNHSAEPVDVSVDGRPAGELAPGDAITARFLREAGGPRAGAGRSFYRRLREKFGLLGEECLVHSHVRCDEVRPPFRSVGALGRHPRRMLLELRVENLLLIERAELRLAPGLNVLTGETGAGKTVLAHALDLLLGGRARPGIVRPGRGGLRRGGVRRCRRAVRGLPDGEESSSRGG